MLWAHSAQTCIWTIYLSFREEFWCIYETFLPWSLPWWLSGKDSACQCRRCWRCRFKTGSGRSPGRGMAIHSSILTWRIPWTEEPGSLQSIGSQRVGHHWACTQNQPWNIDLKCFVKPYWTVHFKMGKMVRFLFCILCHNLRKWKLWIQKNKNKVPCEMNAGLFWYNVFGTFFWYCWERIFVILLASKKWRRATDTTNSGSMEMRFPI